MVGTIGLGANLGDRWANLRFGVRELARSGFELLAESSVWESQPIDAPGPWFLNMVVKFDADHEPLDLLGTLLEIEQRAGRVRPTASAPRSLDLDLLTLGTLVIHDARLVLPHPRMWERRFVVEPLAEVAPELRNPATGRTARDERANLLARGVVVRRGRLAPPGWQRL